MYDCIFCLVTRMRNARLNILLPIVLHMIGFSYASVGALEENTRGYTGNTIKRTKKEEELDVFHLLNMCRNSQTTKASSLV